MTKVAITDIINDPAIHLRQRLDEDTVARYAEAYTELPAVDVFEPDNLLADGAHRIAAAVRLGLTHVEAEIHQGTREDAEEFAITANQKHGLPLTKAERDEGIRRLHKREWGLDRIAEGMSLPRRTVQRVVDGMRVRGTVTVPLPSASHYQELAGMPEDVREPLAREAVAQGWNSVQLRDAGKAVYRDEDGQVRVDLSRLQKGANEEARDDPLAALYGALKALSWLKARWDPSATKDLEPDERRRIDGDLEAYVLLLQKVQDSLMEKV